MDFNMIKMINDFGLSVVIAVVFIVQAQRSFKKQEETIAVLAKLEKNLNTDSLNGKGLEMTLSLKVQELRWSLQKKVINYIIQNNIAQNWELIMTELDVIINEKKQNFYLSLKGLMDLKILKIEMTSLDEELGKTINLVIDIMGKLKDSKDENMYASVQRSIETHFEHFETRMIQKHTEFTN